jgi:hypothetical protein
MKQTQPPFRLAERQNSIWALFPKRTIADLSAGGMIQMDKHDVFDDIGWW